MILMLIFNLIYIIIISFFQKSYFFHEFLMIEVRKFLKIVQTFNTDKKSEFWSNSFYRITKYISFHFIDSIFAISQTNSNFCIVEYLSSFYFTYIFENINLFLLCDTYSAVFHSKFYFSLIMNLIIYKISV